MSFPVGDRDGDGRLPPGQKLTEKFPVMTAGTPRITPAEDWDFTLALETPDMTVRRLARWDHASARALPQESFTADLHCVTRWSKLDTRWRGVFFDQLLSAVGLSHDGGAVIRPERLSGDVIQEGPTDLEPPDLPLAYVFAECDGDYSTNLKLRDVVDGRAMLALDYDAGAGFAPIPEAHGGPARLLTPHLYLWKSPKWIRRLTITPYDRNGYWEKLGYHKRGDPWSEQRYRGDDDEDARRTLDPELSRKIRAERLGRTTEGSGDREG